MAALWSAAGHARLSWQLARPLGCRGTWGTQNPAHSHCRVQDHVTCVTRVPTHLRGMLGAFSMAMRAFVQPGASGGQAGVREVEGMRSGEAAGPWHQAPPQRTWVAPPLGSDLQPSTSLPRRDRAGRQAVRRRPPPTPPTGCTPQGPRSSNLHPHNLQRAGRAVEQQGQQGQQGQGGTRPPRDSHGLPTTRTLQLRSATSFSALPCTWNTAPFCCGRNEGGRGRRGRGERLGPGHNRARMATMATLATTTSV